MSAIFIPGGEALALRSAHLDRLVESAGRSPLRRARYCFHEHHADPVHEMVIAFRRDSYVSPHRHRRKTESFHVVRGELAVVFLDDAGELTGRLVLGAPGSDKPFFYRLNRMLWHTVIPLTDPVVIHETTSGPFIKEETDYAPFAPSEADQEACARYVAHLLEAPITGRPVGLLEPETD